MIIMHSEKGKFMNTDVMKASVNNVRKAGGDFNPFEAIEACLKYAELEAREKTRREEIVANRDVAVAAIQSQRDIIESYFQHRFAERKGALAHFFNLLTQAVNERSESNLNIALTGILGIVKDSPLKDFESFRQSRLRGETMEI